MDIIENYFFIDSVDTSDVKKFIEGLAEEDWEEYADRQKRFDCHSKTRTIAGLIPDRSRYPEIHLEEYKHSHRLSELCMGITESFCSFYGRPFQVTFAAIVMLPAHSQVGSHSDTHRYFGHTHRTHWCISADYSKMNFLISGEKIPMNEGDFIEINNRMPHSVSYDGDIPRYNLIMDFLDV